LGIFKITKVAQLDINRFNVFICILKNGVGHTLVDFFTSSSVHPGCLKHRHMPSRQFFAVTLKINFAKLIFIAKVLKVWHTKDAAGSGGGSSRLEFPGKV
jgi:hypothetical protein